MSDLPAVQAAVEAYGRAQYETGFASGAASRQASIDLLTAKLATTQAALAACKASLPVELPRVKTLSSAAIHVGYGVCAHPTFATSVYGHLDAWMKKVAEGGFTYFRGAMSERAAVNAPVVAAARKYGLKWLMLPTQEDWSVTPAMIAERVKWVAENAADVFYGFEGVNEPNHERSGGTPPADWPERTVALQRAIWIEWAKYPQLANGLIVGASLHAVVATVAQYDRLKALGILQYQHVVGIHSYFGGDAPLRGLDARLKMVRDSYGTTTKFIVTETGWHNALTTTAGHRPISEEAAATYGPRAVLMLGQLGIRGCRYELLDDPDAGAKDAHESNFGIIGVGATIDPAAWRNKPEFFTVGDLLRDLADPGPGAAPIDVPVKVEAPSDVWWCVTAKKDGTAKVRMFRNVPVWDPSARTMLLPPANVNVTITDKAGPRTIAVGPSVRSVALR